jgi:hypothetical protein
MWREKKQLLPKDLAARAKKLAPEKVEAEVLRIVSAKPAVPPLQAWPQMLQPGQIVPRDLMPPPHEWQGLALQQQQQLNYASGGSGGLRERLDGSLWGF